MARYEDLPYRTCVGMMLINAAGLVFIGRRAGGIEHVDETHVWQMPQGGVDPGEDTWAAAKRELYEETSVRSVEKLGEVPDWLIYDIPAHRCRPHLEGPLSRPAAEMVRGALHRQGQRDQRRQPRRRPQGRIHQLALGADEEPPGADRPVQAAGL